MNWQHHNSCEWEVGRGSIHTPCFAIHAQYFIISSNPCTVLCNQFKYKGLGIVTKIKISYIIYNKREPSDESESKQKMESIHNPKTTNYGFGILH